MSDKKQEPELSLAERQRIHKFMTTEEALAWNATRGTRPQSSKHWMAKEREVARVAKIKQDRLQRMRFLASGWKRLARNKSNELAGLLSGIVVD